MDGSMTDPPKRSRLTAAQRRMVTELHAIAEATGMDFWNADERETHRTEFLRLALRQIVNARIINRYTMVDEYLTMIICDYYFWRRVRERTYRRLWQMKEFQTFNHFLMDETYIINKMNIVKAIDPLPSQVEAIINRMDALRNAIAHSLFPENRRKHMPAKKVLYDSVDIYTIDGVRKLESDFQTIRRAMEARIKP